MGILTIILLGRSFLNATVWVESSHLAISGLNRRSEHSEVGGAEINQKDVSEMEMK